jgi:hypothetical protein
VEAQREYIMNAIFKACNINDDDMLEFLLQALVDIGKINYDYIGGYIGSIGSATISFINSDKEKPTTLAIEFWTSLCEVEHERNMNGQPH